MSIAFNKVYDNDFKNFYQDFFGGTVDKNPPANAGDTGSIPSLRRFHVPWNN